MKRAIVTPAVLPASALAELKQWLGISTNDDDGLLSILLRASLDLCEAFTGQMPVEAVCEEIHDARGGWLSLATRPVQAITALEGIAGDGTRTALPVDHYEFDIDAEGRGRVRLLRAGNATRVAINFTAGMAPNWDSLPEALRQGIMRLAAFRHRERDTADTAMHPPASVAALWQPWRRMHLA